MTIDPEAAAAAVSLTDVERVERRTREALYYAGSSAFLIMWGVLTVIGHVVQHFDPAHAVLSWSIVTAVGVAGSFGIAWRRSLASKLRPRAWRLLYAQLVLIGYGLLWTVLLGSHTPRQLDAFWPSLWMFGFVIAGIWVGRFFLACGAAVTLLIVVGYLWIGPWFDLWVAFWTGGALIAGGLWLRRVGLAR